ncbi:glutamine--tRNA ligase, partial [Salmonella enterica subsp. enterica serovar Schwarzengrund]
NKGPAYGDEMKPEQIRENRGTLSAPGKYSTFRDRTAEENLAPFEKMRTGGFEEGKALLRAQNHNGSPAFVMRHPAAYRIQFPAPQQTGTQRCLSPVYAFSYRISDGLEGITQSLCKP